MPATDNAAAISPPPLRNSASAAAAAAAAAATAIGGRRLPLSSPSDATYLSPLVCLMRSQLEIFSATPEDVQTRASFGGLVQKISVERVGVRCIHCRDRPAAEQARGAVSYPASIRMLNQATRNWQRFHWVACQFIPPSAREEFERLQAEKKSNSTRMSKEYWIRRSGEMGLVDTATIRSAALSPDYTTADSSGTDVERTIEPEGIYFEDDARKLGLRILLPPPEKASGTAKKKKEAEGITCTNGGVVTASETHRSDKRKNTVGVSQATCTSGDAAKTSTSTSTSGEKTGDEVVPSSEKDALPAAMHNSFSFDDFADDASFMSDLERLAEEDENDGVDGTCDMDGTMFDTSTNSAHAPIDDSNKAGSPIQDGIGTGLISERDLQLLSTLRATREMVRSLLQKYNGASATGHQTAADLHSLGGALYKTLAGEDSTFAASLVGERSGTDNNDERTSKRERRRDEGQPEQTRTPLQDLGYPTSISIFVESLIDATDKDAAERFTSLSDVDNDLRLMIEFPDKYLFDAPPEVLTGRLGMPSELYGVQTQRSKLMNAFESVVVTGDERHGLALVSGRSGSGKTSLVETLIASLKKRRGRLIQVKFDKKDSQSLPSIFRALDQYCKDLQGDLDLLNEVGNDVKAVLGSFGQILLSLMPNLSALIGEISHPLPTNDNKERYHLLLSCLQAFVRAISSPSHPTVILFDDLQWTDAESLGLITKLVKDVGTNSCLFVGCYRDNEVKVDHPLLEYLSDISFAGVPMWQIYLERIERVSINELLSDTLHLLPRITAPLAREIHKKSGGNPNFAKQLLQSLHDERLLQYSPNARRWQWDINAIRSKNVPDNAVALLLERMTHYGPDVQRVLQVAALMGRQFDASALKTFAAGGDGGGDGSGILAHTDTLINDGLVCVDKAELRFAHDSIWEAAMSLTPLLERENMHLLIGRRLLQAASGPFCPSLDVHLHLIVDQMNRGFGLIEGHDEKLRLAELNLQVGQWALASASFFEASLYLLQGSVLLSNEDWNGNYRLCLDIFTACAEAQLAHGNYDGAIISANAVIVHGKHLNDTLSAQCIVCKASFARGKAEDALCNTLEVVQTLGIQISSIEASIPRETIMSELQKTEGLVLSPHLAQAIPGHPSTATNDTSIIAPTLKYFCNLCKILYAKGYDSVVLIAFRMVQICAENAMTSEASFAFGVYSLILCTLGLRDRSAACAQIALSLLDRFHGEYAQDVLHACNLSIHPYRQPWHACLDSFSRASNYAMTIGDFPTFQLCSSNAIPMHLFAPTGTLQDVWKRLEEDRTKLEFADHELLLVNAVYLQILLNLSSPRETCVDGDPTKLQGDATHQKDPKSLLPQSNMYYKRLVRKVDFSRMFLGYLFRRHDLVLEIASNVKEHLAGSKFYPTLDLMLEKFYLGLAAYSIVRQGGVGNNTAEWQAIGDKLTNEMKALSENDSKWNFQQKYYLLEAEKAFAGGDVEAAAAAYDKAIEAAKEHRFINEQALASECAALFYLNHDGMGQARRYLEQSRDLYNAWGAKRKVDDIGALLETLEW